MPSGGSIVIDQTEALVAIDINSAKATGGSDIEETALNTNLESAIEIGKQLRLRDIGGLVVIDFIDMLSLKNKRAVEDKLWSALSIDRAKVQVGRISRFGLMEMSRQRLRPSLQERWTQDVASLSTAVLRLIEEEASKKKSGEVRAVVSSDMSTFLLNERRARVNEIEERSGVRVIVVSDPTRSDNRFEVTRLRSDDKKNKDHASYDIQSEIESNGNVGNDYKKPKFEKPAVNLTPPKKPKKKGEGIFKKFLKLFEGSDESKSKPNQRKRNARNQRRRDNKNKKPQQRNNSKPINKARDNKNSEKKKPVRNKSKTNTEAKDQNKTDKKDNKRKHQGKSKNLAKKDSEQKTKPQMKPKAEKALNTRKKAETLKQEDKNNNEDISTGSSERKESPKEPSNINDKGQNSINKPVENDATKENVKESNEVRSNELPKKEQKQEVKKAKDWGRASNDPRNKS